VVNGVDNLFTYFASMLDYELSPVAGQISCPTQPPKHARG
jgi:hypothetical protein